MAITKIQCLNEAHTGNPAAHLKNAFRIFRIQRKQRKMFWWAV